MPGDMDTSRFHISAPAGWGAATLWLPATDLDPPPLDDELSDDVP